jgi:hypothetical protein
MVGEASYVSAVIGVSSFDSPPIRPAAIQAILNSRMGEDAWKQLI